MELRGYCSVADHPWHGPYHDREYGFPVREDDGLFERLMLEVNQAGLSWLTILKKRDSLRRAYDGFSVDRVATYGPEDRERLLSDPGVIRNRLKVEAAVHNAQALLDIRASHDSFADWLDAHHPRDVAAWVKLFKRRFRFTGGQITREFLKSTGYLPGAHDPACPIFERVAALDPPWRRAGDAPYA